MNSEGMPVPVPGYTLPHIPPHILDAANQQRQQPQVKQPVPQPHPATAQDNPAAGINFLQVRYLLDKKTTVFNV